MELKGIQFLTLCLAVCISVGYSKAPKKIINGQQAFEKEFPYQVSLKKNNQHFCGGSIIDATHILTAAHCLWTDSFEIRHAHQIQVVTSTIDNEIGGRGYGVAEVIVHNDYRPRTRRTPDIAILRLATPMIFDEYQVAINLASSYTPHNEPVIATGWGVAVWAGNDNRIVRHLRKLPMRIVDLHECERTHRYQITDGNICAISNRETSVCQGDSGGPLVYGSELVGIVSWGSIPCAQGTPDVFTSVAYYLEWIKTVVSHQY